MLDKHENHTWRPWNHSLEPWWSPPSAWMGSTMTPVMGQPAFSLLAMMSSVMARHLSSSAVFSLMKSSRGYLYLVLVKLVEKATQISMSVCCNIKYLGKLATGQGDRGTSILWMYLEWVQAREAAVRPWKPPWKERTERLGVPGALLIMQDSISSGLKSRPPRILFIY